MSSPAPLLAGVELGGTKCVCVLGTGPGDVRATARVPTAAPGETLARLAAVLDGWHAEHGPAAALGIASFGPLDLDAGSPGYGSITASAKRGWSGTRVIEALARGRAVPVGFNTDVNAAALAEGRWGASRGLADHAYVTVGTGVGVGLVIGGRTVLGCHHTELGHVRVARAPGDLWPGACPYHGACVEGLACGPAIAARAGRPVEQVAAGDPLWPLVAHALGGLLQVMVLATAPRRIVLGGGVLEARPALRAEVRQALATGLGGYLDPGRVLGDLERYVVAPGLGALSGPLGALALAADAHAGAPAA